MNIQDSIVIVCPITYKYGHFLESPSLIIYFVSTFPHTIQVFSKDMFFLCRSSLILDNLSEIKEQHTLKYLWVLTSWAICNCCCCCYKLLFDPEV